MSGGVSVTGRRMVYAALAVVFALLLTSPVRRFFFSGGMRWVYILVFAFTLSCALTPALARLARHLGILDLPDRRKVHDDGTPLLGGVAVMVSLGASLLANMVLEPRMVVLLCGALVVGIMGVVDDWRGVPARVKLLVQVVVVLVLVQQGIVLDLVAPRTAWGFGINAMLTLLWIVGITNSMNFFDGMDGLAAGLSGVIALFIGIVSFQTHQPAMGWIAVAILGSCLGFLPFNFRWRAPASVFLGDTGSTFLGFILSGLAILGYWADGNPIVSFATPVLIFWILIFDMTYISVERVLSGKVRSVQEWIDYVGKDHLHHRLFFLLGSKRKAVIAILLFAASLGLSSIVLRHTTTAESLLLILQAALIVSIFSVIERAGRNHP